MLIVERIEGNVAVCEASDKTTQHIPLEELPIQVREGDVLLGQQGHYQIDQAQTQERKQELYAKFQRLLRKDTEKK